MSATDPGWQELPPRWSLDVTDDADEVLAAVRKMLYALKKKDGGDPRQSSSGPPDFA